ncbi:tRNA (N(6)-L-threonylcarbamoyladenosine(37)-C(2))-methylthiotransferase MtaB, partial [Chloroflexota bacterium]
MSGRSGNIRVALDTIGCKLNQAETEFLARQLAEAGCQLVSAADEADIYIVNTCTVTHIADSKSRRLLRVVHGRNPGTKLVAIGCYAERAPQDLAQIAGVDLVLGNDERPYLLQRLEESGYLDSSGCDQGDLAGGHCNGFRTRAFIKVQDGCRSFCAYCIVPLVRGGEKSVSVARVIAEVRQRGAQGYREVVLTGTKVGVYSHDGINLRGLLEHILAETDVIRLRLSSLQPQEISPELIGVWRDERLCRHFHLSLQSGSDSVLCRMKRRYSTSDYQGAVSLIRELVSEVAITTDIIVGLPGETEAEFQESYNFCRQVGFSRIHIFPYSPRQGTEAARMPDKVSAQVKKERSQKMLALARESAQNFSQKFLGKTMTVLWEKQSDGIWSGHTDNY